jgi:hypothetical protein
MKFYFVPRLEPLIRSKRLEMGLLTQRERCAARRSGQRPGQRSGAGRLSQPLAQRENPRHYRGSPMELAGLEPATSWVRSRRALALTLGYLRGFRGGPAAAPDFPPVSAHFGWDRAKEAPFWPDLGSSPPSTPAAVQTISCQPSSARRPASSSSRSAIRSRRLIRFVGASHAGTPRRV